MLRTGFHNGTPLEGGKIADSQPVHLFAPTHRISSDHHQQAQADEEAAGSRVITESEPVDLPASARVVVEAAAAADKKASAQGRQGMAEHAAGGRRLGRQA